MSDKRVPGTFLDLISGQELTDEVNRDVDLILMALCDLVLAQWSDDKSLSSETLKTYRDQVPQRLHYWLDVRFEYWSAHVPAPLELIARRKMWLSQADRIGKDAAQIADLLKGKATGWGTIPPPPPPVPGAEPAVASLAPSSSLSQQKEIKDAVDTVNKTPAKVLPKP